MQEVGPLETGEIKAVKFDLSTEAPEGATLSSPTVTVALLDGTDATPSSVLQGSASVSGLEVVQLIKPGVIGCRYKLVCLVNDSTGQKHRVSAKFAVTAG